MALYYRSLFCLHGPVLYYCLLSFPMAHAKQMLFHVQDKQLGLLHGFFTAYIHPHILDILHHISFYREPRHMGISLFQTPGKILRYIQRQPHVQKLSNSLQKEVQAKLNRILIQVIYPLNGYLAPFRTPVFAGCQMARLLSQCIVNLLQQKGHLPLAFQIVFCGCFP